MTVCVVGSNSFSGASFCAYLLEQGINVLAVSRSEEANQVFLPYRWKRYEAALEFRRLDLNLQLDDFFAILNQKKPSLIFNFAAQSMVGESWDAPEDWIVTNVLLAARIAERLRHLDFLDRYVHVTTPEVYGTTAGWIAEDAAINPSTPYAVSRAAGDMLFKIYCESYGLPVVGTRAANVYGPGQQLYRIVPRTILFLLTGKTLQLHGGGYSTRSFIHIDDVCSATWRIACEGTVGADYHISTDRVVSIKELVLVLCTMLGAEYEQSVEVVGERLGKDSAYWLDSQKLRQLGWSDFVSLEGGLHETIGWVRDNLEVLQAQPDHYEHKK